MPISYQEEMEDLRKWVEDFQRNADAIDGRRATIGVHQEMAFARDTDDGLTEDDRLNNAELLAVHTFGRGDFPARDVLTIGAKEAGGELDSYFKKEIPDMLDPKSGEVSSSEAKVFWRGAGNIVALEVKKTFGSTTRLPPNSPETVEEKGFQAPLIEQTFLKESIGVQVDRDPVDKRVSLGKGRTRGGEPLPDRSEIDIARGAEPIDVEDDAFD